MTNIRIGTRGSPLALAQARMVAGLLEAEGLSSEIVVIKTSGDTILDRALSEIGGKGLFTKEIQEALYDGRIDCAVHSAKDVETELPEASMLAAFLPREDVRDVFIGREAASFDDLPEGATVGTASLRRQALVRRLRPDLKCAVLRGNVQTRLAKLAAGDCDATLLALAGLKRLGNEHVASEILDVERFPPALAQGAVTVEIRREDEAMAEHLAAANHAATATAVTAERGFLAALDGSCRMPIAGLATVEAGRVRLTGLVATPDGARAETIETEGLATDAAAVGHAAGAELKARLDPDFIASWR